MSAATAFALGLVLAALGWLVATLGRRFWRRIAKGYKASANDALAVADTAQQKQREALIREREALEREASSYDFLAELCSSPQMAAADRLRHQVEQRRREKRGDALPN